MLLQGVFVTGSRVETVVLYWSLLASVGGFLVEGRGVGVVSLVFGVSFSVHGAVLSVSFGVIAMSSLVSECPSILSGACCGGLVLSVSPFRGVRGEVMVTVAWLICVTVASSTSGGIGASPCFV